MKVLLDSMMPDKIGRFLIGHEITHVVDRGWQHLSNGKLLQAAESKGFGVLITKDTNMPYQQNLEGRTICLIVVRPFEDLSALAPEILRLLPGVKQGTIHRVN